MLERISLAGAGTALAALVANAVAPALLGHEMDCFPYLVSALLVFAGLGALGALVAAALGSVLLAGVLRGRARPTTGRVGGLAGSVAVALLVCIPPIRGSAVQVYDTHTDSCLCKPGGFLGRWPEAWKTVSRLSGKKPRSSFEDLWAPPAAKPWIPEGE